MTREGIVDRLHRVSRLQRKWTGWLKNTDNADLSDVSNATAPRRRPASAQPAHSLHTTTVSSESGDLGELFTRFADYAERSKGETTPEMALSVAMSCFEATVSLCLADDTSDGFFRQSLGRLLFDIFETTRKHIYVDHIPYLAETSPCEISNGLRWVMDRAERLQVLTTHQQAVQKQPSALLRAHSDAFSTSMQERHESDIKSSLKASTSIGAKEISFMRRRQILKVNFRAWRAVTLHINSSRRVLQRADEVKSKAIVGGAFLRWRWISSESARQRRSADLYLAANALKREEVGRQEMSRNFATSAELLHQMRAEIDSLKGNVDSLQQRLLDYQNPMVFDFREAVKDHRGNILREGTLRFRQNPGDGAGITALYGPNDEAFFDLVSSRDVPGICQPRKDPLISYYHIRVDLPMDSSERPVRWVNQSALAFCRSKHMTALHRDKRGEDTTVEAPPWEQKLLTSYRELLEVRKRFHQETMAKASKLRQEGGKNRCVVLTTQEPTPSFFVRSPGELAERAEVYLGAMFNNFPTAAQIALSQAKKMAQEGVPDSALLHGSIVQLGCAQQVSLEEFQADIDSVHFLTVTRLQCYSELIAAIERDQNYRAKQRGDGAQPVGPSGVLRLKKCRSLLGMVTQRDGADYTADRSAMEILAWVREVLAASQLQKSKKVDRRKSIGKKARQTSDAIDQDQVLREAESINIQNLEEDFGDGLELLVSIISSLCPASHVPTVGNDDTAENLVLCAEYLIRTASEELKAHIPRLLREQLHTCTPSVKLMYLTAVYCVLHKDALGHSTPQQTLNLVGCSAAKIEDSQLPIITPSALSSLHPYLASTGAIPQLQLKTQRLLPLFGKAQAIDTVVGMLSKVWSLLTSVFFRYAMWSYLKHPGDGIGLCYPAAARFALDVGLTPSGLALAAVVDSPQFSRIFVQSTSYSDDEIREDGKDSRPILKPVPSILNRLAKQTSVSLGTLAEFVVRLACWDSVPNVPYSQWQQGNVDKVDRILREFVHHWFQPAQQWIQLDSVTTKPRDLADLPQFAPSAVTFHPYKICDPRTVRSSTLFTPDNLRLLKGTSSILVQRYIRHSHFTVQTWKLLDQREMTCSQFLTVIGNCRLLEVEESDEYQSLGLGFHSQCGVQITETLCTKIFGMVACGRAVKGKLLPSDAAPIGVRIPTQAATPGTAVLETKAQTLSGHSLSFSGFVEAIVALSQCLHPLPWIHPTDRLAMVLLKMASH